MRIAVLYTKDPGLTAGNAHDHTAVEAVQACAEAVAQSLRTQGHAATKIVWPSDPLQGLARLRAADPELIFNLVESVDGNSQHEARVAALLELSGFTFTGSGSGALSVAHDKGRAKALLQGAGVRVPEGYVVADPSQPLPALPFPWIVKPVHEDASHGITERSVVHTAEHARTQIAWVSKTYIQPALVETYIDGREFNVALLGPADAPRILPLFELDFSGLPTNYPRILTYEAKWQEDSHVYQATMPKPAQVDALLHQRICETAQKAYAALGLRGYGRVDIRLHKDGTPYVLEVNPNPDISPDAGFARAARAANLSYDALVAAIVEHAGVAKTVPGKTTASSITIVPIQAAHRAALESLLKDTDAFLPHEIDVALEVIDEAYGDPNSGYWGAVAMQDNVVTGYYVVGPTPVTEGTYDLYWIATAKAHEGRGVGRALLAHAEARVAQHQGRQLLIETAGKEAYARQRKFYRQCGYGLVAVVPDFYAPGDDKWIYAKTFAPK